MRALYLPYLLPVLAVVLISCSSSKNVKKPKKSTIETTVTTQTKAAIVGGLEVLHRYLRYPPEAKEKKGQLVLKAKVLVNKKGNVDQISFDSKGNNPFKKAAKNALRKVQYSPAKQNGKPVNMFITVPIRFEL